MSASSPITTHVLDTAEGSPAEGLALSLARRAGDQWEVVASGVTNADGRVTDLLPSGASLVGHWRMQFETGPWLSSRGRPVFYPQVQVEFVVPEGVGPEAHYHIPLLLSPFGYSTYRGS
ncbi:MAG: hydroxyisourate hydrolase [Bradymonadia bacterium]